MNVEVRPARRLSGEARVPGDKSITHRALLLGAVAGSETVVRGYLDSGDCRASVEAVRALGRQLNDLCGLPTTLRDAGVSEEQLGTIAKIAINDGSVTYNPEHVAFEDALAILKKAY